MKYSYIHKSWIGLFALVLIFTSCQKVIEIPIDDSDNIFIIEAVMKDWTNASFIKVSKSVSIYSSLTHEVVSGAVLTVTDENLQSWVFTEDPGQPGLYLNNNFIVEENMTYNFHASI